jgi:hypothetical protein
MPLIIWAAQTMAASNLLGVGETTLNLYISPTSAASKIQYAYRHYLSRRNRILLPCLRGPYKSRTDDMGDLALCEDVDVPPGASGDMFTPPAGDILAPPADAAQGSLSTLEDLVRANAAGIAELREMMRANVTTITALSNTVTTTLLSTW